MSTQTSGSPGHVGITVYTTTTGSESKPAITKDGPIENVVPRADETAVADGKGIHPHSLLLRI